jgi:magnesium-transporting ATPase (P-type)
MEFTGPPPMLVTSIYLLIALAIIVFALWRGEQAWRQRAEELTQARTRRAYLCFLAWGAFVSLAAAVAIVSEPYLELVGFLGALPVGIVAAVGLFHALMLWRVRLIQALLIVTILVIAVVGSLPDRWAAVIAAGYGLGIILITVQGLRSLHRGAAS